MPRVSSAQLYTVNICEELLSKSLHTNINPNVIPTPHSPMARGKLKRIN